MKHLLEVKNLVTCFHTEDGVVTAVDGFPFISIVAKSWVWSENPDRVNPSP